MGHIRTEFTHGGAIRRVILDRPEKRNAIAPDMFADLLEAFQAMPSEVERATIIQSTGKVFSAGVDLQERLKNGWPIESPLVKLCEAMRVYPLPIVGALQGPAVAGGTMMALHCDYLLAAEGGWLSMPLAQIGIAPPWILSSRTVDRVGPALGREMLLLGNPVTVERLAALNSINEVVPREEFDAAVEQTADRLAGNAPLSLRAVKAALTTIGDAGSSLDTAYEDRLTREALDSQDAVEGMAARLEKRQPAFQGR